MDQLRRDYYQDDEEGTKNQQIFDQQVENFLGFAHDGFSICNLFPDLVKLI